MPMPQQASRAGDRITVRFAGVEGPLRAFGGSAVMGVELCGDTQESCRFVLPRIADDTLVLDAGGEPATRVRHAWSDAPIVNLYDQRGLPIPGFELAIE